MRQLTDWLAAAHLSERATPPGWEPGLLPGLVTLRELSPRLAGLAVEDVSDDGRVVLIFDGLDEVPERLSRRVREAVAAVLRAHPKVQRVIVTSRTRSYAGAAALIDLHRGRM